MEAIDDAIDAGFTVKFIVNERGFGDNKLTYLPETVAYVKAIHLQNTSGNQSVLYLLEMVDGICGWTSSQQDAFAKILLEQHLDRIKENFKQNEL